MARARLESRTVVAHTALTTQRVLEVSEAWNSVSPDGRHVARHDDKTANLVLYELSTGTFRPLTSDGSPEDPDHRFPGASAFSRDGRQIAYEWYVEIKDQSILRVIGTDEGAPKVARTVYDNPDADESQGLVAGPSMDCRDDREEGRHKTDRRHRGGRRFAAGLEDGRLVGSRRALVLAGLDALAYHRPSREGALERDVYVIAVDGSREVPLAPSPGDDMVLEWTPDGQRLLIASDRGGSNSVWSVAASGEAPTSVELVKSDVGIISSLRLTRDGTLFYNMVPARPGIYTAQSIPRQANCCPDQYRRSSSSRDTRLSRSLSTTGSRLLTCLAGTCPFSRAVC